MVGPNLVELVWFSFADSEKRNLGNFDSCEIRSLTGNAPGVRYKAIALETTEFNLTG